MINFYLFLHHHSVLRYHDRQDAIVPFLVEINSNRIYQSRLERLKRLVENGMVTKEAYQQRPVRYSYILTEKGKALSPIVEEIGNWGLTYIEGTAAKLGKVENGKLN